MPRDVVARTVGREYRDVEEAFDIVAALDTDRGEGTDIVIVDQLEGIIGSDSRSLRIGRGASGIAKVQHKGVNIINT